MRASARPRCRPASVCVRSARAPPRYWAIIEVEEVGLFSSRSNPAALATSLLKRRSDAWIKTWRATRLRRRAGLKAQWRWNISISFPQVACNKVQILCDWTPVDFSGILTLLEYVFFWWLMYFYSTVVHLYFQVLVFGKVCLLLFLFFQKSVKETNSIESNQLFIIVII